MLLDKQTSALDLAGVVVVRTLPRRQATEPGAAVLVSCDHLDEMARTADRISVLHDGRVVGRLDPHGRELERRFFAVVEAAGTAQS